MMLKEALNGGPQGEGDEACSWIQTQDEGPSLADFAQFLGVTESYFWLIKLPGPQDASTEEGLSLGSVAFPVDKIELLAPWITLAALIFLIAGIIIMRRFDSFA